MPNPPSAQHTGGSGSPIESIDNLLNESKELIASDPGQAAKLADQAHKLAIAAQLEVKVAECLVALGRTQHFLGNYTNAKASHQQAKSIFLRLQDKAGFVSAQKQLADIAAEEADYKQAMSTILTCKSLYAQLGDTAGVADCFNSMGFIEHGWSNFDKALDHYLAGLRLLESTGQHELTSEILHNIGVVHAAQKDLDEAISYLTRSLNIGLRNNDRHQQASCHADIGSCLNRQGKYDQALEHQLEALKINREMKGLRQVAVTLRALASTYSNLGDFHKSLSMLQEARDIRVEINDMWGIADIDFMRGDVYLKLGDLTAARESFQQAHTHATKLGTRVTILKTLRGLANVAEAEGDYQSALTHLKEYSELRETIYNEEKHKQIAELNVKYETEQKDIRLQQSQKLEAIGTLAGGIAHDFNNILFTILGYTEMAIDRNRAAGVDTEELDEIMVAGLRAKDLVHQILAFSRKSDTKLVPTDIIDLVQEVYQLIRHTFPPSININLDFKTDNALVKADPSRLHQVIMNLCTNARQAMLKDGGRLNLSIMTTNLGLQLAGSLGLAEGGEYVVLEVADSGSGIPTEILDRIFEPFFTTKQDTEGTGLGLSVVHGLISDLGGTVNVFSEPGAGTTFTVYLPRINADREPGSADQPILPFGTETIMVIDDEPSIADMIGRTLSKLGYNTHVFTDARLALEELAANPERFDLIVTDLAMPLKSGDMVAKAAVEIRDDLPVIVCTGYDESLPLEKRAELGIRDVLLKPATREQLAQSIREVLDQ